VSFIDAMPYFGVRRLLDSLHNQGFFLYLATNKRLIPTKKIIECISLEANFQTDTKAINS
jgi:phosphoglycolate phosphatase-like HAD superfamily hydrolase